MKILEKHIDKILLREEDLNRIPDDLVPVDINAIANWYYVEDERKEWSPDDYPTIVPPWKEAWFEYYLPKKMNYGGEMKDLSIGGMGVGMRVFCERIPEGQGVEALFADWIPTWMYQKIRDVGMTFVDDESEDIRLRRRKSLHQNINEDNLEAGWMLVEIVYLEMDGKLLPMLVAGSYLDKQGKMMRGQDLICYVTLHPGIQGDGRMCQEISGYTHPAFFAITLMNCKNVELKVTEVPPKVRKKREKKGRFGGVDYRTLHIHAMSKQTRSLQKGKEEEDQRTEIPASIRRGGWKDYRGGNGLFGKYHGLYWWDQHEIGNREVGKIEKTYVIEQ